VTGILTAASPEELSPEARPFFGAGAGGVRHRWIEVFVPGLGWVPSDPAGLANTVSARHVALSTSPDATFELSVLSRSAETRRPRLSLLGPGVAVGRLRTSDVEVSNQLVRGGAVVLVSLGRPEETPRVVRTETSLARFDKVLAGDYRVVWKRNDGRLEAASLRVDGPSRVELPGGGK
jgi:transglutaminase-like putative cysteine protease